jgi:rod shape-determining protein MreB
MREQIESVGDAVHSVLEITPPEMSADIADRGIYVTGGGALLRGMDVMINRQTGITTTVANTLSTVLPTELARCSRI